MVMQIQLISYSCSLSKIFSWPLWMIIQPPLPPFHFILCLDGKCTDLFMLVCFKNSSTTPSFSHSYRRTEAKSYTAECWKDYNWCCLCQIIIGWKDGSPRTLKVKAVIKGVGNTYSRTETCLDDARSNTVDPDVTLGKIRSKSSS